MQANETTPVRRISAEDVKARLGRGEPIVFVDSRNPTAWAESDVKLPGAIRVEADRVRDHLSEIPRGRPIVAYCT
jgi:rhodanese-related sulfurtransferase